MTGTPDLFADAPLPGLALQEELVSALQEAELVALLNAEPLAPFRFQGWLGKRLTRSFGWSYDFDRGRLERGDPIPDWLLPIRERAASLASLGAKLLEQVLLTRYEPGAGIGWHKDRASFEHVVGISLGAACDMRFRRRRPHGFDRVSVALRPRSAYRLTGEVRHGWEHSIVPLAAPRWSITFRSLSGRP